MSKIVHYLGFGRTACQKEGVLPALWPVCHEWSNDWEHVTCPDCLKGKEPIDTFVIALDGKSITCKRCGRTSYNLNDVQNRYCGYCKVRHEDIWPPARKSWIETPTPDMKIVNCDCGFRLGIKHSDWEEIKAGVWGTIPCPQCKKRLNDKIALL